MSGVQVTPEFLQNVVGFATATNELMAKQASAEVELKKAAEAAVVALEKAGSLGNSKKEDLVAGIVAQPALALELVTKLAEEKIAKFEKKPEAKKEEAPAAIGEKKTDAPVELGAAAEGEKEASKKGSSDSRESDDIWNKGFNF